MPCALGGRMKFRNRKLCAGDLWLAALALIAGSSIAVALAPAGSAQAPQSQSQPQAQQQASPLQEFEFNSRSIATFTAAQAAAGKDAYAKNCASCHGVQLNGSEFASALRGLTFTNNWGGRSAVEIFNYLSTKMPPASP